MFIFAYRLSYNNILDFTQWPCGIPFSHFESNLAQWTYSRVRLKCTCELIRFETTSSHIKFCHSFL